MMEICVEIEPVRTLLVLGPQVTAQCISESNSRVEQPGTAPAGHPTFLEYRKIVENGIKWSLELANQSAGGNTSSDALKKREKLLWNAYELEPVFATNRVLETLREHGAYDGWMKSMAQSSTECQFGSNPSPTLQYISTLRSKGARLVYTHYDDLLSRALSLPAVLPDDEEGARKWSQGFPALLHIHGAFSNPQSIKIDSLCYKTQVGEGKWADILREQFQSRAVVFVGFDDPLTDPLINKILSVFASVSTMPSSLPVLLSCLQAPPVMKGCITLKANKLDLASVLKISNTSIGVAPMMDTSHPVSVTLTLTDTQTTQNIMDILRHHQQQLQQQQSGGAGTNSNMIPKISEDGLKLSLQMSRPLFHQLWSELLQSLLLSPSFGLVAIHLEGSFIARIQQQGENRSKNNAAPPPAAIYNSSGQLAVVSPLNSSLWKQPISLATASPSPTTISPISGLSQLTVPASLTQQQFIKQHEKVRRIHSENDGLVFVEKQDAKKRRANGLLTHQQSAPIFPFIASQPQGGLIQGSHINIRPPLFAVPTVPSMMFNVEQQKKAEHQQSGNTLMTTPGVPNEVMEQKSGHKVTADITVKEERQEKGFEKKKLKFIHEAKQWSKTLEEKLGTKPSQQPASNAPSRTSSPVLVQSPAQNIETFKLNAMSPSHLTAYPGSHLNPTHSPILTNQKKPPTYLMGTAGGSQSNGIYTILPTSPMTAAAGNMLPNQVPLLTAFQQANHSPSEGGNQMIPMVTPSFNSEQGLVYMIQGQDGNLIPTPIVHNKKVGGASDVPTNEEEDYVLPPARSPKRVGSPNSDTEIMVPYIPRKRRRSSSLPITNIKSPSSSSDESSDSTPPPHGTLSSLTGSPTEPHQHLLTFPQITSPSTGHHHHIHQHLPHHPHHGANLFFTNLPPHLMATPTGDSGVGAVPGHHCQVKMEAGDTSPTEEKGSVDNDTSIATPSSPDNQLHPVPVGRGPIQLWQFLLDLLISPDKNHMIQWTGNGYEFRIVQPEEIAKLWGARKNKPRMNYDKLSRGLRYYYSKGIMDKVPGKKLTFKYTCNIQQYMSQRSPPGLNDSNHVVVSSSGSL